MRVKVKASETYYSHARGFRIASFVDDAIPRHEIIVLPRVVIIGQTLHDGEEI
jgi:hypothetical protein